MSEVDSSGSSTQSVPSELRRMELFDKAASNFLTHTGAGLVIGTLASIVLFRSSGNRKLLIGLLGGFGAGVAYQKSSLQFDKEILKLTTKSKS